MIYQATRLISDAFKEAGLKCGTQEVGPLSFVEAGFTGSNCTFKLRFISTDNDNDICDIIYAFSFFDKNNINFVINVFV